MFSVEALGVVVTAMAYFLLARGVTVGTGTLSDYLIVCIGIVLDTLGGEAVGVFVGCVVSVG